jgi:hypothetical protein
MRTLEAPRARGARARHELPLEGLPAMRAHDWVGRLGGAILHMAKLAEN